MARVLSVLLLVLLLAELVVGNGESRKKGSSIIRQKRQYMGYPYGMGYPYSYGFGGYSPYMMYRPYPMYGYGMGMPYYRPYGFGY